MLKTRAAALLLTGAALLPSSPLLAQQKYDLTDLPPVAGTKTVDFFEMQGEDGQFIVAFLGQKIEGEASMSTSSREVFEIIAVEDEVVTEYHTTIVDSSETFAFELLNEKNTEESESVLLNVPVRWRLIDEVYVPSLVDGDPTEEQLEELQPDPYNDVSGYPDEPVAVGETWTVDGDAFAEFLGANADEGMEGSAEMTLQEIVELDGEQCAKIAIKMIISSAMPEADLDGMEQGKISLELEGFVYRSLDKRIDVKIDCEGKFVLSMSGKTEDIEMTTTLDVPITLVGTTTIVE